ncbi:MAG: DUF1501 domain-containing protein [Planctomycetes bacterium]|nr:DUF1501 domain-containing protein [Planctomycetota bacterium]
MLTISERGNGMNRRAFLTLGSLGLGGLTLSSLFASRAAAAETASLATGKSVIFLFQQGGPSQFETFDPKMDAPEGIRTVTGQIQTALSGVQFGDRMPLLAKLADKFTIVRSFQTNNAGHNIQPIVSADSLNANIGSLYSRVVGATRPTSGMPTNAVIYPDAVCSDVLKGKARGDLTATGTLGADHAPFVADALDLTKEDPKTIARYDTRQYTRADGWSKVARGKAGMYTGHSQALGKQLLMARRLCEAGCGFVTIHDGYDGVWDMHADGNNLNMKDGMEAVGPAFDHAVAAFIDDLEARGLKDKILLICCGEMGRTPRLNKNGGRDHWSKLSPLLLYGGGIPAGQVIGRSNRDGGEPTNDPLNPKHLISTILHALFDTGRLRVAPSMAQVAKLAEHPPIPGLF